MYAPPISVIYVKEGGNFKPECGVLRKGADIFNAIYCLSKDRL